MSEIVQQSDEPQIDPAPAPPPRPLNLRARRRSWRELPVRIWLVLAGMLALVTLYFMVSRTLDGRRLRWLLSKGQTIDAVIYEINGTRERRVAFKRSDPLQIWIKFELPGEPNVFCEGMLAQSSDPKQLVRVGDPIRIRIDPKDIEPLNPIEKPGFMLVRTWTDRTAPPPWYIQYTVVLLLAPLLLGVALFAWWRRRRVLRVWETGEPAMARVIGHRHTAVAPRSRIVRFTLEEGGDRRVWTALHPARDLPAAGELIWVIHPPNYPARAIVANLYE